MEDVLKEYTRLQKVADEYYTHNKHAIEASTKKIKTEKILREMPTILKKGYSVWCRNGNVCLDATICKLLECKYKKDSNDVAVGCSKCQRFQITAPSNSWYDARHTHEFGSTKHEELW